MSERWLGGARRLGLSNGAELADKPTATLTGIFSDQLERLVRLRTTREEELNSRGIRMLDHDIVTRINDLRRLGHANEARQIINPPKEPPRHNAYATSSLRRKFISSVRQLWLQLALRI